MSLRRSGLLLAMVASAVVAGCGSSGGGASGSSSSSSSATLTPAQYANAVNLRSSDLPGFTSTPHHESASDRQFNAELARCAGTTPDSQARAHVASPDFKRGSGLSQQQVSSAVTVVSSPATAQHDVAAVKSAHGRSCLETFILRGLIAQSNAQVKFTADHIASLPVPATGVPGFGYRITLSAQAAGTPLRFVADAFGFASGSAEVSLTTFAVGHAPSSADENRLFTTLVGRARRNRV